MMSSMTLSMTLRRPRAPVLRSMALWAMARSVGGEAQGHVVELEQLLVLPGEGVLGLGQDTDEVVLAEIVHVRQDRDTAHEFGDEPELHEVGGMHLFEELAEGALLFGLHLGPEAHAAAAHTLLDDLVQADERPAHDEQDVRGVHADELLLRVLAAPLGGMLASVPSMILSSACWTPSPDTSRVMDGPSALREILSISSM